MIAIIQDPDVVERILTHLEWWFPAEEDRAAPARTAGEALRYHLWQYEDVSGTGFKGDFAEWGKRTRQRTGCRSE